MSPSWGIHGWLMQLNNRLYLTPSSTHPKAPDLGGRRPWPGIYVLELGQSRPRARQSSAARAP
jgi:hypothetical protein